MEKGHSSKVVAASMLATTNVVQLHRLLCPSPALLVWLYVTRGELLVWNYAESVHVLPKPSLVISYCHWGQAEKYHVAAPECVSVYKWRSPPALCWQLFLITVHSPQKRFWFNYVQVKLREGTLFTNMCCFYSNAYNCLISLIRLNILYLKFPQLDHVL